MSPKEFFNQASKVDVPTILKIVTAFICTLTFCFTAGMYYQGIMTELHSIKGIQQDVDTMKKQQSYLKETVLIHGITISNNTSDINLLKETILYGTTRQSRDHTLISKR
jgi:hypothetical protein